MSCYETSRLQDNTRRPKRTQEQIETIKQDHGLLWNVRQVTARLLVLQLAIDITPWPWPSSEFGRIFPLLIIRHLFSIHPARTRTTTRWRRENNPFLLMTWSLAGMLYYHKTCTPVHPYKLRSSSLRSILYPLELEHLDSWRLYCISIHNGCSQSFERFLSSEYSLSLGIGVSRLDLLASS
jgi:hypothetical protein